MDKYQFTDETIDVAGKTLHRIIAVRNFGDVKEGALGGYIESESNLSHDGEAWVFGKARVYGEARVYGSARVSGNALVYDKAEVYGTAWVYGKAWVFGKARVYGTAWVYGEAWVCGEAEVYGEAHYIVFKNFWSSGRYFTWTRSDDMWTVGCFHGKGEELIAKAYKDSEKSGRNYERVVRYVETLKNEEFNK